jgi:hypothetical protein
VTIGALEVGDRVVDKSLTWGFRHGPQYTIDDAGEIIKPIVWIVTAKNHFEVEDNRAHVTLLSEEIVANYPFDDSTNKGWSRGCGHWGDSGLPDAEHGIRPFLNNIFLEHIEDVSSLFSEAILTTVLQNDTRFYADYKWGDNWRPYTTLDKIFILSATELGERKKVNDGDVLPYFDIEHPYGPEDSDWLKERRIAYLLDNYLSYHTRTPEVGRNRSYLSAVYNEIEWRKNAGNIKGNYTPSHSMGIRPAINVDASIKVSNNPNNDNVYTLFSD